MDRTISILLHILDFFTPSLIIKFTHKASHVFFTNLVKILNQFG